MADAKQLIIERKEGAFTVLYDAEDHDKVSNHKWRLRKDSPARPDMFYVVATIDHPDGSWHTCPNGNKRKRQTTLSIHRLIMDAPKGMEVDHINGNPLDNRKSNLRICTRSENERNKGPLKNNTSGYKGVTRQSRINKNDKWRAQIRHNSKLIVIGLYEDKEEAARAYDKKAKELHGEYAYLNFPDK